MNVGRMGADWVIGADMLCGCVVVVRCGVLIRALVLTLVDSEALPKRQDRVPTPVGARQRVRAEEEQRAAEARKRAKVRLQ